MKGTLHRLKLCHNSLLVSMTACSVPFANGVNGKDIIKIAHAGKNIQEHPKEGINEELIRD